MCSSDLPLVMGLILGKLVEESLSQSMIMFDSNWFRFFESPIVNGFFLMTALGLLWPVIGPVFKRLFGAKPKTP